MIATSSTLFSHVLRVLPPHEPVYPLLLLRPAARLHLPLGDGAVLLVAAVNAVVTMIFVK